MLLTFVEVQYPSNLDWKWIAFALNTLVLCGYIVHWFRGAWRLPKFWLTLFLLLLLHSVGLVAALRAMDHFPLIWYAVLVPLELQASITVFGSLGIYPGR